MPFPLEDTMIMEMTVESIHSCMGRKSVDLLELVPAFSRALRKHDIVYVEDIRKGSLKRFGKWSWQRLGGTPHLCCDYSLTIWRTT